MMHKHLMIPALLAACVSLAACSTDPNANLEQARTNYNGLQADPAATKVAALETKDAASWPKPTRLTWTRKMKPRSTSWPI